jgi:hypothetical protein
MNVQGHLIITTIFTSNSKDAFHGALGVQGHTDEVLIGKRWLGIFRLFATNTTHRATTFISSFILRISDGSLIHGLVTIDTILDSNKSAAITNEQLLMRCDVR